MEHASSAALRSLAAHAAQALAAVGVLPLLRLH
jgi:hypothetical protein